MAGKYTKETHEAFKKWYNGPKGQAWYQGYKEKHHKVSREYRQKVRNIVIDAYGGQCACCGETRREFLTIDHVNGWGKDHKTKAGRRMSGSTLCLTVIKENFPDTYRILCYNCNCSLGFNGYCPHDVERSKNP